MAKRNPFTLNLNRLNVHISEQNLIQAGMKRREALSAEKLNTYIPVNRDPLRIIYGVEKFLIPELLPLRHERMAADVFSFYRGTAELMANDLAKQNHTHIPVIVCGDAHINNYGFFASPERKVLFDLNDFDEAHVENFENDLRRLLVSVYLGGELNNFKPAKLKQLLQAVSKTYRHGVKYAASLDYPERFYFSSEIQSLLKNFLDVKHPKKATKNILDKVQKRNSDQALRKYTTENKNSERRFIDNPPRTVHVSDVTYRDMINGFAAYRNSTRSDTNLLLRKYHIVDVVRHSVGVGSFGTRCYLVLLRGNDGSYLILQVKEALPVRDAAIPSRLRATLQEKIDEGKRITITQRILQTASDPFLGNFQSKDRSYYVRQFRDMKASVTLTDLDWQGYQAYVHTCSFLLAIAHFQSPSAGMITGYLKQGKSFDASIADWSVQYAVQVHEDYNLFITSLK